MRGPSKKTLEKSLPSFARGLPILLVDHDILSLTSMSLMLKSYSFNVTTARSTTEAMSIIPKWDMDHKDRFKLIMAHLNLEYPGDLLFLRALIREGLQVILISSIKDEDNAEKALVEGASLYLEKPIAHSDLKYIWQQACRRRTTNTSINSNNISNNVNSQTDPKEKNEIIGTVAEGIRLENVPEPSTEGLKGGKDQDSSSRRGSKRRRDDGNDDVVMPNKKLNVADKEKIDDNKGKAVVEEANDETDSNHGATETEKKSRFVWTKELHLKFMAALSTLGDQGARPKSILEMMNVPTLTQRQVASHLQKYKTQVARISQVGRAGSVSPKKQEDTSTRRRVLGIESFGFESLFHNDPFIRSGLDKSYYRGSQRTNGSLKPTLPTNPNHSLSPNGGSDWGSGDSSGKESLPEAEGNKLQFPEPNASQHLDQFEKDMDQYFSDLPSILNSDELSLELNLDFDPRGSFYEVETPTQNVPEYILPVPTTPSFSPIPSPVHNDVPSSEEAADAHLINSGGSGNSNESLRAHVVHNPIAEGYDEIMRALEGELDDFTDLEGKPGDDDGERFSDWLEELLVAPGEEEISFVPKNSPKM